VKKRRRILRKKNILFEKYSSLSFNIRERRKELKLTQKELAKKVGVSFRTIQNYENGITPPSLYIIEKIALALEVSVETLISQYKFDNNFSAQQILEKVTQDKEYKSKVDNLILTDIIFDIVDLEIRYQNNKLDEIVLDKSLGGRNKFNYERKYYLLKLMLEQKLQSMIEQIKSDMIENYSEVKKLYRETEKDVYYIYKEGLK